MRSSASRIPHPARCGMRVAGCGIERNCPSRLPYKSEHEITVPVEVEATTNVVNTESSDDVYEVVEMQVTSSSKARNSPAQIPQEDSAKTQHVETEVHIGTEDTAGNGDNQEAYEIMNVD